MQLVPVASKLGETAQRWQYVQGEGEIGVISSVTQAFCRDCTRLRLSADGKLYTCLFASQGYDVRGLLRGDADDMQISNALAQLWHKRADRYSELRGQPRLSQRKVEMSYIGG
jgi:cyclic pyranopterin phosphate synthase